MAVSDFYQARLRRQEIDLLREERRELRARLDVLDEALNERDVTIMELRDALAEKDRRIDALEGFPVAESDVWSRSRHPSTHRKSGDG
jgi:chromosome segregation ATPase